jgi:hypothetical protein
MGVKASAIVLGAAPFQQFLSSRNDVSYADVDRHYDGNPNDLSDRWQRQEPSKEENKNK